MEGRRQVTREVTGVFAEGLRWTFCHMIGTTTRSLVDWERESTDEFPELKAFLKSPKGLSTLTVEQIRGMPATREMFPDLFPTTLSFDSQSLSFSAPVPPRTRAAEQSSSQMDVKVAVKTPSTGIPSEMKGSDPIPCKEESSLPKASVKEPTCAATPNALENTVSTSPTNSLRSTSLRSEPQNTGIGLSVSLPSGPWRKASPPPCPLPEVPKDSSDQLSTKSNQTPPLPAPDPIIPMVSISPSSPTVTRCPPAIPSLNIQAESNDQLHPNLIRHSCPPPSSPKVAPLSILSLNPTATASTTNPSPRASPRISRPLSATPVEYSGENSSVAYAVSTEPAVTYDMETNFTHVFHTGEVCQKNAKALLSSTAPEKTPAQVEEEARIQHAHTVKSVLEEHFNCSDAASEGFGNDQALRDFVLHIPKLVSDAKQIVQRENTLLTLHAPVFVIGDLHGNFEDLSFFCKALGLWGPHKIVIPKFLFLGDYVDRGKHSVQVVAYLLTLKILYPRKECTLLYASSANLFLATSLLPSSIGAKATIDGKVFCVHGGIPNITETCPSPLALISKIARPIKREDEEVVRDLMWSDPMEEEDDTGEELFIVNNDRGRGHFFSKKALDIFCSKCKVSHIIRAHQVVQHGVEIRQEGRIVTVFSSSGYANRNEAAAILIDDGALRFITKVVEQVEDHDSVPSTTTKKSDP
ncbi:Serine/threonine-protein phosphatase BSU1 [Pelomyxa schiedti]|nr:Serine/threonine-protein phosphatase BSU1 [Pelomyxa schiedti]